MSTEPRNSPELPALPELLLNLHRHAIGEALSTGDHYLIARLQATQDSVVIAGNFSQLQRTLVRYGLAILLLGNEGEELAADAGHCHYRHGDARVSAPGNAGTHQLHRAEYVGGLVGRGLRQYRLRRRINLRRDEVHLGLQQLFSFVVDHFHRSAQFDFPRALRRDGDVHLEAAALVNGSQRRGVGDAVANVDGNVADDSVGGREHAEILQLHLLLVDLRVQRLHVIQGGVVVGLRLVQVLLADDLRLPQSFVPLQLDLGPLKCRLFGSTLRVVAGDGGLLAARVDLHQGLALFHDVAGLYLNSEDPALDVRHDGGR